MNAIDVVFRSGREAGRRGVIPYFTAGFPTMDVSATLIRAAAAAGAAVVEIGVPFSDPIADGPVIQRSSQVALKNGVNLAGILEMVSALRSDIDCPVVLMGYANNFMQYGYGRFAADAAEAGVDGVIVPDLPPEESGELIEAASPAGLATIFLVAQTSTPERISLIGRSATGFVYYVARLGVTGVTEGLSPLLAEKISLIRGHTDLPVAAGFGISTPDQAAAVTAHADAAIMGSALIRMVMDHRGPGSPASTIERFLKDCVKACS